MFKRRLLAKTAVFTAVAMAVSAAPALAKNLNVANGTSPPSCAQNADYSSIQAAVDAANPGDHIKVCPGTYQEHVVIGPGKDNLDIQGHNPNDTFIQFPPALPPAGNPDAILLINGAQNVEVHHFTIEGPYSDDEPAGCGQPTHYGVFVEGGGSAQIDQNTITLIQDANQVAFGGCQDGLAVRYGSSFLGQTASGQVNNNLITDYQKNGVTIDGAGTSAQVNNNTILGDTIDPNGINPHTARNGVQFGRDASGQVNNNTIEFNEYAGAVEDPDGNDAGGVILLQLSGGVQVNNNDLFFNDLGLDVGQLGFPPVTGLLINNNKAASNRFNGLRAESNTSQNTFNNNQASGTPAPGFDCRDDSTGSGTGNTANTWKNDKGQTSQPAEICKAH